MKYVRKRSSRSRNISSRRYKRKLYNKKKRYLKKFNRPSVRILPFSMPDKLYCKYKFTESTNLVQTSNAAPVFRQYRGNNAWDPLSSVGGGTCTYYQNNANPYSNQTVIGSKLKVFFIDNGTDQAYIPQITLIPDRDGAIAYTTPELTNVQEIKWAKMKIMEPSQSSNNARGYLSLYMSTAKIYNVDKKTVKSERDLYGCGSFTA